MFRVSRLEDHKLDTSVEDKIIQQLKELSPKSKGIVIFRFCLWSFNAEGIGGSEQLAIKHSLMLFGDLQCSSQVGSITKFQDFSLLCPNEREARIALYDRHNGLEQISQKLIQATASKRLVMKLGSDGFIAYEHLTDGGLNSQAFPALCANPIDVAGAGDSFTRSNGHRFNKWG